MGRLKQDMFLINSYEAVHTFIKFGLYIFTITVNKKPTFPKTSRYSNDHDRLNVILKNLYL